MTIVAEIGTAHSGSLQKAYKLIDGAKEAGADAVKFQWVYADEILHPDTGFVNLPGGKIRLYDRFKSLEVSPDFFSSCLEYTHQKGMKFICSPFGIKSLEELIAIKPDGIKIASPELNHFPMLKKLAQINPNTQIIISSGVSTLTDIEKAISILSNFTNLTLLHCITCYPAPEDEYNVRCVKTLHDIFGVKTGISDHSLDPVLVPVLTTSVGGTMIEKHITLSKKTDGLDDPVALEVEQFAHMVHCVRQTEAVLNRFCKEDEANSNLVNSSFINNCNGQKEVIRQLADEYGIEKINNILGNGVKKLALSEISNYGRTNRSLHYLKDFKKGDHLKKEYIGVLRTEKILTPGISPEFLDSILGSVLQHNVTSGAGIVFDDLLTK